MTTWRDIKKIAVLKLAKDHKDNREYYERLKYEIEQITLQGASDYWTDLYDSNRRAAENPNGLILPYLIGLTDIDPIEKGIEHNIEYHPDYPDIDIDFLPIARDQIKKYAAQQYGDDKVCSVGLWQRYKPKLAILDACRTLGLDITGIQKITKNLPDEFDDMDFDEAYNAYPEFAAVADDYKDAVKMAYRLVKLIKAQGRHAGGLLISSVPVRDHIPLTLSGDSKHKTWTSAWTEGKSTQLSKFGFVKFDILGLTNLLHIWNCKKLLYDNRGVTIDWTDMDPEADRAGWEILPDGTKTPITFSDEPALDMAHKRKVDTIFQFETDLARSILQKGGVKSFRDLVIYTSLGRPGPLPLVDEYVARRDGKEWKDEEEPQIVEMLDDTYGIIVFQEQLARFFVDICGFTIPEAEAARKAVAKKWAEQLAKIKDKMIAGATRTIGEEKAIKWWGKIESFARYCFNRCLDGDTILVDPVTLEETTIESLYKCPRPFNLLSYDGHGLVVDEVVRVHHNGILPIYKITFDNGHSQNVTMNHRFMNAHGEMETVSSLLHTGHAIKYISKSMAGGEHVSQIKRGNRRRSREAIQERSVIQRNQKHNQSVFVRQYHKSDNKETWGSEAVRDPSLEHCGSQLFYENKLCRKSLLAGLIDGRWVSARKEALRQSTIRTNRYRNNKTVRQGFEVSTKNSQMPQEEFFAIQSNCKQQTDNTRFDQPRSDTRQIWQRDYAEHKIQIAFHQRHDRRRWYYLRECKRLSNDWIGIVGGSMSPDTGYTHQSLRDKGKQSDCWCAMQDLLDRPAAVQRDSGIPVSEINKTYRSKEEDRGCHIVSVEYIGLKDSYSPEMRQEQHNYITAPTEGQPIHRNSHALAYIIISYRCLWLKSHYPAEWWAAVMSNCKRDKLIKYMGIARSEGVQFGALDFQNLHKSFNVNGDIVTIGIESIKDIGGTAADKVVRGNDCKDLNEFVNQTGKTKKIYQRLIRLGAFDKVHPNRKALWHWYLYKHGSCNESKDTKKEINNMLAWSKEDIEKEKERMKDEYFKQYPRRKKVPDKITKWKPKISASLKQLEEIYDDYSLEEKLQFEKEYLGYYWTSPLALFNHEGYTIADAKQDGILEVVVEDVEIRTGASGQYLRLTVTDGVELARVMIWNQELQNNDDELFNLGMGLKMRVEWREQYSSFNLKRGSIIFPLEKIEDVLTN